MTRKTDHSAKTLETALDRLAEDVRYFLEVGDEAKLKRALARAQQLGFARS